MQFFKYILLLSSLSLLGCSVKTPSISHRNIDRLTILLYSINSTNSKQEAQRLARDIYYQTSRLTKEFELVSPPLWHNFLVNIGIRKKGLCYHWSDALFRYFKAQNYPSFEFHLVGANIGKYWSEHNAMVVISKGGEIKDGIVIDPWRNSGKLYYSHIQKDEAYKWSSRANRERSVINK